MLIEWYSTTYSPQRITNKSPFSYFDRGKPVPVKVPMIFPPKLLCEGVIVWIEKDVVIEVEDDPAAYPTEDICIFGDDEPPEISTDESELVSKEHWGFEVSPETSQFAPWRVIERSDNS